VRIAVVALFVIGCGHSVLIPPGDLTYRDSIAHYQRTRALIAATLAPDDEQARFLQAEAFYRYRFEPPGRSVAAYFVQAAASLIDLPVLDSVAGALDLYSLRVRINDASVQLWESLLDHHPTTPLRALTLYRLGFAYRNSLSDGFPRESDDAFAELETKFADSPLTPLARAAQRMDWKSQSAATAWSIVPGLGQMYAGHYASGAVRLAIASAAAAALIVPSVIAVERGRDLSFHHDWPLLVTAVAGAVVLTVDYSSSYQDARAAAIEYNERAEAAFEAAHPDAP
jgi:hypothetical protein